MNLVNKHISEKLEKTINDEIIVDLLTKSFNDVDRLNYNRRIIIDDNMVMRPDLLAMISNNTNDYSLLLKTNYISNPFTLDTNDVILMPFGETNAAFLSPKDSDTDSDTDIRNDYVNPNKAADTDPNIQKINNKFKELKELGKNAKAPSVSNLPPNFNEFGNGEVQVINNRVKFAPGVSRDASECSTEPISKAELISQVLKNKLNNS